MYAKTYGETTCGIYGVTITVEVDVANGLPSFNIVGLPDLAVKESRERVKAALKNSGYEFPGTKILVNLAPADLKKDGSGLDLPIAIGILLATKQLLLEEAENYLFIGELALDGKLRGIPGVLPMIIGAKEGGKKMVFIPEDNAAEGELVDGLEIYAPASLKEVVSHLKGERKLSQLLKCQLTHLDEELDEDFSDVKGQVVAKRALEIAAAGGHNLLMVGAPGSGKTMLARRLRTILPPLTEEEALEVTKIYSVSGLLKHKGGLILDRPFRSPHHTVSRNALVGGGRIPKPGEVTLSHKGVLFLDELPEFSRSALEVLRQPLEDGVVSISRVEASLTFPADFILVAAENPCPCGFWQEEDEVHHCICTQAEVDRYQNKISGPLLDRIDMQIHVGRLKYEEMGSNTLGETSYTIRQRVIAARNRQLARYRNAKARCNSMLTRREIKEYCQLDEGAQKILGQYFKSLGFSARNHDRIIKVAQTIADLAGMATITMEHVTEAVLLRTSIQQ